MHQSSANVGVATADLFPAVSISGAAGSAASALAGLGGSHGRFWSDGADVSVPLFQGGTLWYTRRAAQHAYEASLQEYRQVVLLALDQVADSLRALDHDAQAVSASARAAAAAQLSRELAQTNYQAGVADYLAVLVALRGEYSAQLAYAQAVAQRLQDAVVLFVALGGDWSAVPRGVVEGKG